MTTLKFISAGRVGNCHSYHQTTSGAVDYLLSTRLGEGDHQVGLGCELSDEVFAICLSDEHGGEASDGDASKSLILVVAKVARVSE